MTFKIIKTFVYTFIGIIIAVMITSFNIQKKTFEEANDQKFMEEQTAQQNMLMQQQREQIENNIQSRQNQEQNQTYYADPSMNVGQQSEQYSVNNTNNSSDYQSNSNDVSYGSAFNNKGSVSNSPSSRNYHLHDPACSIVTEFNAGDEDYLIISKLSEYQSRYSDNINKKYYIYKYKNSTLYEIAYIIELAVPNSITNDKEIFDISVDKTDVVIKISKVTNTSRRFSISSLKSASLNKMKSLSLYEDNDI